MHTPRRAWGSQARVLADFDQDIHKLGVIVPDLSCQRLDNQVYDRIILPLKW